MEPRYSKQAAGQEGFQGTVYHQIIILSQQEAQRGPLLLLFAYFNSSFENTNPTILLS